MRISKAFFLLVLGLTLIPFNARAQDSVMIFQQQGVSLCEQGRISEGIVYLGKAKERAAVEEKWAVYPEITTYYWFAYYQLTGDADTVLKELDKVLEVAQEYLPDSIGVIGNIHLYKGIFFYYNAAIKESIHQSELALDYFEQDRNRYLEDISSIYNNLGVLFSAEGNYYKAEDYIKKAISLKEDYKKSGRPFNEVGHLANYLNLGRMYYAQKRYAEFEEYMTELENQIKRIPNTPPNIRYQVNQKLARYYLRIVKDQARATTYLTKLQEIEKTSDIEPMDVTSTQHLLAESILIAGDTTQAIEVITTSTQKLEGILGLQAQRLVEYYINLSEFFGRLKYFDEAYFWSNKANALVKMRAGENLELMDGDQLQTYAAAIGNLACLHYFNTDQNPNHRSEQIKHLGETYLSTLRVFANRTDKLISNEGYLDFSTVLSALMEVHYAGQEENPEAVLDAMELLELKQGLPLIKNQKDINLIKAAGVSDEHSAKIKEINVKLAQLRSEYALKNAEEKNNDIASSLVQYNEEKDSVTRVIQKQIVQAGFRLLEPVNTNVSQAELQRSIGANECLLQFLNDRRALFVIFYTNDQKFIYTSDEPGLNDEMLKLHTYLSDPEHYNKDSFQQYSHQLYKRLILPFEEKISDKDLVIMPTGSFNYIPFEILIKDPEAAKPDYLLKHHAVRYLYSLKQAAVPAKAKNTRQSFVAFAPDFSQDNSSSLALRKGYGPLMAAQKEVEQIAKSYPFQTYLKSEASKQLFVEGSKQSNIIHLATHALINNQDPLRSYIVFAGNDSLKEQEQILFAYELYEMQLDADLAVLSACNTGAGQLTTFDGVVSLAKAFDFAGVRSTVMSLWSAQDETTAEIMDLFYSNLAAGYTKSKALQMAKLTYLENTDPVGAQPFYWAPFVLQGDNEPIPGKKAKWPWFVLGSMILLVVYLLVRRSSSKRAASLL